MNLIKKALTTLGSISLVALLIAALAPKATHGLVAALVQIVPGTTTHLGQNESQLVSLQCQNGAGACFAQEPSGVFESSAYQVPAGYTLVITDYEWVNIASADTVYCSFLGNSNSIPRPPVYTLQICAQSDKSGYASAAFHSTTGLRVASGIQLFDEISGVSLNGSAAVQGYLVPN